MANATLFERRLDLQGEQIPCESPRSSIGTSTRTAAGLSCPAHHAHTVRIGRSVIRLRLATIPPWTCGPRNSRGVIVLFVAMKRLVTFHRKSRALSSSSTAVVIELWIASTIDEFVARARITRDDRVRAMSALSPRSGKSCYTPVPRARSQLCTTHSMRSLARDDGCARLAHHRAMMAAHFSPIMTHAACVGASTITGMIDASATRTPSMPCTRSSASTTASRSDAGPMRHVPAA